MAADINGARITTDEELDAFRMRMATQYGRVYRTLQRAIDQWAEISSPFRHAITALIEGRRFNRERFADLSAGRRSGVMPGARAILAAVEASAARAPRLYRAIAWSGDPASAEAAFRPGSTFRMNVGSFTDRRANAEFFTHFVGMRASGRGGQTRITFQVERGGRALSIAPLVTYRNRNAGEYISGGRYEVVGEPRWTRSAAQGITPGSPGQRVLVVTVRQIGGLRDRVAGEPYVANASDARSLPDFTGDTLIAS